MKLKNCILLSIVTSSAASAITFIATNISEPYASSRSRFEEKVRFRGSLLELQVAGAPFTSTQLLAWASSDAADLEWNKTGPPSTDRWGREIGWIVQDGRLIGLISSGPDGKFVNHPQSRPELPLDDVLVTTIPLR